MEQYRNQTKEIKIGNRVIGGGNPILIQSMTNTKTEDVDATVSQILALEKAGCEIVRCAVPTMEAAEALREIREISAAKSVSGQLWTAVKSVGFRFVSV